MCVSLSVSLFLSLCVSLCLCLSVCLSPDDWTVFQTKRQTTKRGTLRDVSFLYNAALWRSADSVANVEIQTRYVAARDARRYVTAHVTVRHAIGRNTRSRAHRQLIPVYRPLRPRMPLVSCVTKRTNSFATG